MKAACDRVGLTLANYELVGIHGVSIIFHLTISDRASAPLFQTTYDPEILPLVHAEDIKETYLNFNNKAQLTLHKTQNFVSEYKNNGYKIALAGVAAKALTFYHSSGIQIDYFIDEAELKLGRFVPGENQPIHKFSALPENEKILIIVGAWNFYDEIKRKLKMNLNNEDLVFLRYFQTWRLRSDKSYFDIPFLQRRIITAVLD